MSIQIGTTPIFSPQPTVINIISNRSNVIKLNSETNDVFIETGNFRFGQIMNGSNARFTIQTTSNEELANFSQSIISLLRPISAVETIEIKSSLTINSNLKTPNIYTSNIEINSLDNGIVAYITQDGNMFLDKSLGIGTFHNSNYSIYTTSNILSEKNIFGSNVYANSFAFEDRGSGIYLTSNTLLLDADTVLVNNLNIQGLSAFDDILVKKTAVFDNTVYASNVILLNKNAFTTPLAIRQRLINNNFGDLISGNSITVISEFPDEGNQYNMILSARGHLVLGGLPGTPEYSIRVDIPSYRSPYFSGFLNFTNSSNEKDGLTVNKNAHVAIGNTNSTAMFEVKYNYDGSEPYPIRPTSLIKLQNAYAINTIPYLDCILPDNSFKMQITSNATISFYRNPINPFKYEIESSNLSVFNTIEVNSIRSYSNAVNFENSTVENIGLLNVNNSIMSNVFIHTLTVDDLYTDSLDCIEDINNYTEMRLLPDRLLMRASNIVINRDRFFFTSNETSNLTLDTIRLYTTGTITDNVQSISVIGANNEITMRTNNASTAIGARISDEFIMNDNRFKIGVINKNTIPNATDGAILYITPFTSLIDNGGIDDTTAAINIFKDRLIKFGNVNYLDPAGYLSINTADNQKTFRLLVRGSAAVRTVSDNPTLTIDSTSPFVGINTTAPNHNLQVDGSIGFNFNNQARFHINGNIGIGTANPIFPVQVRMDTVFNNPVTFTSNVVIEGRLDTLNSVASTSDSNVKKDLSIIKNSLDKIQHLSGYTYTRTDTLQKETGLIAQEVLTVLPEAVYQGPNGLYTLAYGNLTGLLVEAIKELKQRVEQLESRIK
jgi:hypothetical protein